MSEYSGIGAGKVVKTYVETAPSPNAVDIFTYLNGLYAAGKLAAPNANSLVVVHLSPTANITLSGNKACPSVSWKGILYYQRYVPFMVITDCSTSNTFDNISFYSSRNIMALTTDAWTGYVSGTDHAWFDKTNNGNILFGCGQYATLAMGGINYAVANRWSNQANGCVVIGPATTTTTTTTKTTTTTTTTKTTTTTTTTLKTTTTRTTTTTSKTTTTTTASPTSTARFSDYVGLFLN